MLHNSRCTACSAGQYTSSAGLALCLPCPPGTYASLGAAHSCERCDAGQFQFERAQTSCRYCTEGKYNPYRARARASSDCFDCPAGKFGYQPGQAVCFDCPPGTIQPKTGSSVCHRCPSSKYVTVGSMACGPCQKPEIYARTESALWRCATAAHCHPGFYSAPVGGDCTRCPMNKYQEHAGQSVCTSCTGDYWTAGFSASLVCSCKPRDCMAGEWGPWSACSKTCGGGTKVRQKNITHFDNSCGKACSLGDLSETQSCGTSICGNTCTQFGAVFTDVLLAQSTVASSGIGRTN